MEKIGNICYPEEFNNNSILAHIEQQKELKQILKSSGLEKPFCKKAKIRYKFLATHLGSFLAKTEWYESPKNANDIYAIKVKGLAKNIRILFCIKEVNKKQTAILLTAFEERKGSDYSKPISIAQKRLKELVDKEEVK